MKTIQTLVLQFCLTLFCLSALSACGQKGPIKVEDPILIQEEVLDDTI